jgi:hypothetical protein
MTSNDSGEKALDCTERALAILAQLRQLERDVARMPVDTRDRQIASQRIQAMIGDQISELTWWRNHCDVCGRYLDGSQGQCNHGPVPV